MNVVAQPEALKPKDYASDQEVRWCPVRRLRHPPCRSKDISRHRGKEGKDRFCFRDRMCGTVPLLPLNIWFPYHSRTRAFHRHRDQDY